jgi:pimeloyl-ACP methyl ester carboxylesterase
MSIGIVMKGISAVLILMVLMSCSPPARIPLDTITYPYREGSRQECLIVFLPGRGGRAIDFSRKGFIERVRQAGLMADMLAADLHLEYYLNQTAAERLRLDVIAPARDQGYRCLWLVGISLGGFGALEYEIAHPGDVSGIVLLAPYLGGDRIITEISQAGSVKAWNPGLIARSDYERRLWSWVRDYELQDGHAPIIYLGYGNHDRFAVSNRLLGDVLGPERTITAPGGHTWSTWTALWEYLLREIPYRGRESTNLR